VHQSHPEKRVESSCKAHFGLDCEVEFGNVLTEILMNEWLLLLLTHKHTDHLTEAGGEAVNQITIQVDFFEQQQQQQNFILIVKQ